jgi:hypothetical protein
LPNDGATAATRSAKAHAIQASKDGSTVKYKLNCSAWPRLYSEDLVEADSERWLKISAATEQQSSGAFGNLLLSEMHRAVLRPSCPGVQFGPEACSSENIESFKTPLSEEL